MSLTRLERLLLPMADGMREHAAAADASAITARSRAVQARHRASLGYAACAVPLLTPPAAQPKLAKSHLPTYGLTLLPAMTHGIVGASACPMSTAGCRAACLATAGKGGLASVESARRARTRFLAEHPREAGVILAAELAAARARHGAIGMRWNVNADIRWELVVPDMLQHYAAGGVRSYDYTKWPPRHRQGAAAVGLHLTYSAHERMSVADIAAMIGQGRNVSIVFDASKQTVVQAVADGLRWQGLPLTDGVSTDDRTGDAPGTVVALAALGRAKGDRSGFVRHADFHRP